VGGEVNPWEKNTTPLTVENAKVFLGQPLEILARDFGGKKRKKADPHGE